MSDKCYKCGSNTKNIGCHSYSGRSSYPSGSDRGGSRSSGTSSGSGSLGGSSYRSSDTVSNELKVNFDHVTPISPPNVEINGVVLGTNGWYNPTDLEIAKGVNPHYKILPSDSQKCIYAKQLFNTSISNAYNIGETTSVIGLVGEIVRIKADMKRSLESIKRNCGQNFDGSFTIQSKDFDKFL